MPLQIRRGTDVERRAMTVPLAQGELLYVTDDQRLYIGNGATLGGVQITGYTNEDAQDATAQMIANGTHSGITFTYNDASHALNATVSLAGYNGFIEGDLQGSVFADNSTRLIDGTNGKFNLSGTINTSIVPDTDVAYDLGSSSYKFRDLYLSGSSIHLGNALITSSGTAVNLPAGSLIGGVPIGSGGSDVSGNIIGDDSTVIVNTHTKSVTATGGFYGNLTGDVTGDVDATNLSVHQINAAGTIVSVGSGTQLSNLAVIGSTNDPVVLATAAVSGSSGLAQPSPFVRIGGYRGSYSSKTTLLANDAVGQLNFQGHINAGSYGVQDADLVSIRAVVEHEGDLSSVIADAKLQIIFVHGPNPVDAVTVEISSQGVITSNAIKTVVYSAAGTPLPSASTAGMGARAFVSDATANTFATAYTSGGSNKVPVYSDGTSWYIG